MPTKEIQCSWWASSSNMKTIPGSFRKQAMFDTVPLWLLFKWLPNTSQLWIQTGIVTATQDKRRCIPVHEISESSDGVLCNILSEAHALMGCDTASAIYGIGKNTLMKVITKSPENFIECVKLSGTDGDAALEQARKLLSTLYDQRGKEYNYHHDLDKFRTRIAKQKYLSLSKILLSQFSSTDLGTPLDFGWIQEQGMLSPYTMKVVVRLS